MLSEKKASRTFRRKSPSLGERGRLRFTVPRCFEIMSPTKPKGNITISNYSKQQAAFPADKVIRLARPIAEISQDIVLVCPTLHAQGGVLHAEGPNGVVALISPAALFAHLRRFASIDWASRCHDNTPATKEETWFDLASCVPQFSDSANLPHEPKIPNVYYHCPDLPKATGKALDAFLDKLNPDGDVDRTLLEAALLTPGWGGPPGARPAFLLESDHGQNAGKTSTAHAICNVWGEPITGPKTRNECERFKSRLLHPNTRTKRTVLVDNVKRFEDLEVLTELLTDQTVNDHQLFHGDASRPNRLSFFITANGPALSKDLAERVVVIKIGRPRPGDFRSAIAPFAEGKRRLELIADCLAKLRSGHVCTVPTANFGKWGAWSREVLQRVHGGDTASSEIIARRQVVDSESEAATEIEEAIADFLRNLRLNGKPIDPDQAKLGIPTAIIYDLLRIIWQDARASDKSIRTDLDAIRKSGALHRLQPNPTKTYGRCFTWIGARASQQEPIAYPWHPGWCAARNMVLS